MTTVKLELWTQCKITDNWGWNNEISWTEYIYKEKRQ